MRIKGLIPGFDFLGDDIVYPSQPSRSCLLNTACIGYNSAGSLKSDFQNPGNSTGNFYVHAVKESMNFIQLKGWDSSGGNMADMPLTVLLASSCAHKCSITYGCVGAVYDGISLCWLKSSFNTPSHASHHNLLLPVGTGRCPLSFINTSNCLMTNGASVAFWNAENNADDVYGINNGTFGGTPEYTEHLLSLGRAFSLNGNNYVEVAARSSLDIGASMLGLSISFRVNAKSDGPLITWNYYYYHDYHYGFQIWLSDINTLLVKDEVFGHQLPLLCL